MYTYIYQFAHSNNKEKGFINLRGDVGGARGRKDSWERLDEGKQEVGGSDVILFQLKAYLKSKSFKRRQLVNQPRPSLGPTQKDNTDNKLDSNFGCIPASLVGSSFPSVELGKRRDPELAGSHRSDSECRCQHREQVLR